MSEINEPDIPPAELTLLQEELCRVIAFADRWQTCELARMALNNARRIGESVMAEVDRLSKEGRSYHGASQGTAESVK